MRELHLVEFVTLDGVMQGFGSADEDRDGGFEHGGWGAAYVDDVQMREAGEALGATTGYLFGRRTYEKMAAFWPHQPPASAHRPRKPHPSPRARNRRPGPRPRNRTPA